MDINQLLKMAVENGASDLHLIVPATPTLRINGILTPIAGEPPLTPQDTLEAFECITTDKQLITLTFSGTFVPENPSLAHILLHNHFHPCRLHANTLVPVQFR